MNVLQIVPELKCGGVETGTLDLSRRLVESGHRAFVISAGGPMVKQLESCGAVHIELPVNEKSLVNAIKLIGRVARIIQEHKIDIVHARSRVPAWIGYFAARRSGRVFLTTCHGYYSKHPFSSVMGWGKMVVTISRPIARHMTEDFGVPVERIRLIPRGVDIGKFEFSMPTRRDKDFTIGIVGRLSPIKGHTYFLKSLPMVVREVPRLRVLIIGDASKKDEKYKESLVVLSRRLGLSKTVEFLGHRDDIPQLLKSLDLLVLATTVPEAFGRTIIEAHAAGVPVVATRVGGVVDIIQEQKTGLLVEPEQPAALAEAIIKIYKNPGLARDLAVSARKKVEEEFNLDEMFKQTMRVYEEALHKDNILILKLGAPGDVVAATPSLRAIREKFPNARISVLTGQRSSPVLLRCPHIDDVTIFDKGRKKNSLARVIEVSRDLRRYNFDMTIDLQNNLKTHLLAFLCGAGRRFGYSNGKLSSLLNHRIAPPQEPLSPLEHQQRLLNLLGIRALEEKLELWLTKDDAECAERLLDEGWLARGQILIGFNLGSSKVWLTKRWPLMNFARLQDELARALSARVVLFGTKDDLGLLYEYKKLTAAKPIDAIGKTSLMELAALIKRCDAIVSSDSAPIHVAAAVGTPFVALFGPTDPALHLPPAADVAVIKKELHCSPCYRRECHAQQCMKGITVDEVFAAVKKLLKNKDVKP